MFDEPGIGFEDLAWIQRDQFVHYVEQAPLFDDPHAGRSYVSVYLKR